MYPDTFFSFFFFLALITTSKCAGLTASSRVCIENSLRSVSRSLPLSLSVWRMKSYLVGSCPCLLKNYWASWRMEKSLCTVAVIASSFMTANIFQTPGDICWQSWLIHRGQRQDLFSPNLFLPICFYWFWRTFFNMSLQRYNAWQYMQWIVFCIVFCLCCAS